MEGHTTRKVKAAAMFSLLFIMFMCTYIIMTENKTVYYEQGNMLRPNNVDIFSQKLLNPTKDKLKFENKNFPNENFFQSSSTTTTSSTAFARLKIQKLSQDFAETGSKSVEKATAHAWTESTTTTTQSPEQFSSLSAQNVASNTGKNDNSNFPINKFDDVEHMYLNSSQSSSSDSYDVIHTSRIRNIRRACSNETVFRDQVYHGAFSTRFFSSKDYNFAYCKVPKSGSTFWMQIFTILEKGVDIGAEAFNERRSKVHSQTFKYMSRFETVKNELFRTILVSRDPYSRLYSAYVDKSFLPLVPSINNQIKAAQRSKMKNQEEGVSCPFNVSFQEFLDWVIDTGSTKTLNRHWAPIISLCRPCEVNSFILVKQESFSKDVEFALRQVGVAGEKFDYIMSALHEHRAEFSLPGIIETVFKTLSKSTVVQTCLGSKGIAERTWHSFQIQGYINKHIEFPEHLFSDKGSNSFSNTTYFTEIVLDTIKQKPLSSTESKQQRLDFLLNAYEDIHEETIKGIQNLYKQDFIVYGYTNQPPRRYGLV